MVGMKKYILLILLIVTLIGCTKYKDGEPVNKGPEVETEMEDETEPKKEKFETKKIKLDDEFSFRVHHIEMDEVKIYEKDDNFYADIKFDWTNLTGEEFSLQALSKMEVFQNGESIDDVSGDWDPVNSNKIGNDAFFTIKDRVTVGVSFTYELIDEVNPIEIVFYAIEEDDKKLTIEID